MKKSLLLIGCSLIIGCSGVQKNVGKHYGYKDGLDGKISKAIIAYEEGKKKAECEKLRKKILDQIIDERLQQIPGDPCKNNPCK